MGKARRTGGAEGNYSTKKAFGLALQRIRREKGLTQAQLADRAGYHRNLVSLIERGVANPSLTTLFDLAGTMGIRPSQIVRSVESLIGPSTARRGKK